MQPFCRICRIRCHHVLCSLGVASKEVTMVCCIECNFWFELVVDKLRMELVKWRKLVVERHMQEVERHMLVVKHHFNHKQVAELQPQLLFVLQFFVKEHFLICNLGFNSIEHMIDFLYYDHNYRLLFLVDSFLGSNTPHTN